MTKNTSLKIIEEKNVFTDHLLDIMGAEFQFDHAKGSAEWLKNAVDAYIRVDIPDHGQHVIFRFTDDENDNAIIECIDFVGMTENDITKAFKRWGDPDAAKRGINRKVYGGHGNGGKFYMRQMFDRSHFVTYREGYLNIFGFSEKKRYGFADGYKNKKVNVEEALRLAGIEKIIFPAGLKEKILTGKTGFTIVKGFSPVGMRNKIKVAWITDKFKNHPQSRRILSRINVSIIHNNKYVYDLLRPEDVPSLPGFENPRVIPIPPKLIFESGKEKISVELSNTKFAPGKLILKTSDEALSRGGRLGDLNRIDFLGEIGVIASYQIFELGVSTFPQAAFIYGECECPILEDPDNDCVKNDRTKLAENSVSGALLRWVAQEIDKLGLEISSKEQKERGEQMKKISSNYNEVLNQWKDRFMKKVFSEAFGGSGPGTGDNGGNTRRHIEAPENGLEFVYTVAEIPLNESYPLTLKVSVPDPIPFGSIISLSSNNNLLQLDDDKVTVKSEFVKLTEKGEAVALVNIHVLGLKVGERGEITASAGKFKDSIQISVIAAKEGSGGKKLRYPKVLLSGTDKDPLGIAPEGTVFLTDRNPLIFQRPQDVTQGFYWINTSSPIADLIINHEIGGAESKRWRDYLFQRYVDIFVKEALHKLENKEPDNFRADIVDSRIIDDIIRKIHTAAAVDLENFLFEEIYKPSKDEEIIK